MLGSTSLPSIALQNTSTDTNGGYGVSININPTLNPLEVLLVVEHYKKRGIEHYDLIPGNDCIWAYYGRINEYFVFRDGKLVDIQTD